MTEQTPKKPRWRSPLNAGVTWLENRPPLNAVYQRVALWIGIMGAVVGMAATGLGLVLLKHQNDDEQARGRDRDTLLACFDRFATDLSGSLPPVRKATQKRDQALLDALIGDKEHLGLGSLLVRAQAGVKSDPKKDLADLVATFTALKLASDKLVRVRKANPYPPAPSKFCDLP